MRFFCLTHRPVEWPVPTFMELISTVPAGDGVLDLSERYPQLRGRGVELSEYATLFALRRMLQESWEDGTPPPGEKIGIAHYRRFAVTRPTGKPSFAYGLVRPEAFVELPDDLFLPPEDAIMLPAPATLGAPLVTQYGAAHHVRDLLHFMAMAVDLEVVPNDHVAVFLGQNAMIPAPTVGVYPAEWLVGVLESIETVVDAFEAGLAVPREGYQRRAVGFSCERLHALLAVGLVNSWPTDRVIFTRPIVVSEDEQYRDGG